MYIDQTYYDSEFIGEPIDDVTEFNRYAKRASEMVDQLTKYRIKDINKWTAFVQEQVKKATAAQVEFYGQKSGSAEIDAGDDYSNFVIGSFQYSKGGASKNKQADRISPAAITYLEPTGLLYTGVTTC